MCSSVLKITTIPKNSPFQAAFACSCLKNKSGQPNDNIRVKNHFGRRK